MDGGGGNTKVTKRKEKKSKRTDELNLRSNSCLQNLTSRNIEGHTNRVP